MQNISVYAININDIRAEQETALSLITTARKSKALRYRFEADRLRCIAAGLMLRKYCNITSDDQVTVNAHGKPSTKGQEFNISHSGEWAVLCTASCPVGIDIELINKHNPKTAAHCFCSDEIEWMEHNPNERFYMLWTRKESIIKAIGKGLQLPLNSFCVLPFDNSLHTIDGCAIYSHTKLFDNYAVSLTAFEPLDDFDIIIDKVL